MQTNKTSAPSNLVPLAYAPTSTRPKVDPALEQALSISNFSDAIVFFAEPDGVENYSTWLGAILAIRQDTAQDDILFLRETFLSERQSLFQNQAFSIIEQTDACGMDVFYLCSGMPCFLARISHDCLYTLDEHPLVQKIDASKDGSIEADGLEIEKGTQLSQFVDNNYEGYVYSGSERLHGAVIEPSKSTDPEQGPPRGTHFGFRSSSSSWSRVTETEYCSNNGSNWCFDVTYTAPFGIHSTIVAGIMAGDLTDGQEPQVTDPFMRKRYSGAAREIYLHLYEVNRSAGETDFGLNLIKALDEIASHPSKIVAANLSSHVEGSDPDCMGDTTYSLAAMSVFESGTLLFKSAGNEDHPLETDCTVTDPGSAMGVFTVGAHESDDESEVRAGVIATSSSLGGASSTEGRNRSIIDLTGPGDRKYYFGVGGDQNYNYLDSVSGTSYSTPWVAGSAVDFVSYYKNEISDAIDDPGLLFANMLLMGDRESQTGKISTMFSNLWGGGRIKMRLPELGVGLANPSEYASGSLCVGNGNTSYININNASTLSPYVDVIKAVIYWFDSRYGSSGLLDDLDLSLQYYSSTTGLWHTHKSSTSRTDEKERVFQSNPFTRQYRLAIKGYQVASQFTECGGNSIKVFYAYFFESNNRGGTNEPGTDIDPE